jgi:transcriptional regulator, XRE family
MCEVPLAELGLLSGYEPLLEPLVDYLLRSSSERRTEALSGTGLCALRVGVEQEKIGLTAGSIILLESGRYPEPDSLNLIALRDGSFLLREYRPEGELVRFRPLWKNSEPDIVWKRQEIPARISWLHPVLELTLRPLHFPRSS